MPALLSPRVRCGSSAALLALWMVFACFAQGESHLISLEFVNQLRGFKKHAHVSSCWLACLAGEPSSRRCCSGDLPARQLHVQPLRSSTKVKIADRCGCRWRAHGRNHRTGSCGCTCLEAESAKLHFNGLRNKAFSVIYLLSHCHKQASLPLCSERAITSLIILLLNFWSYVSGQRGCSSV